MMPIRPTSFALLICLALAACSGSPSESDVRQAAIQQVDAQQKAQTSTLGNSSVFDEQFAQQRKLADQLKLIGCKANGEKAYDCDIEIAKNAVSVRLVHGSNGWLIASN